MENIIEIKSLTVEFKTEEKKSRAIDSISLTIPKGTTVAIVGESGSGKSVTALSILRLIPSPPALYTEGSILFSSKQNKTLDLLKLTHHEMEAIRGQEIGFIFQEPMTSLNPLMRCGLQVSEMIVKHRGVSDKEAKKETIHLFEKVKLPLPASIYNRYPHELSGGQKQRVMIAMAISCSPQLLIADEPTTALDVTVQKSILELIKSLQIEYGMSVLFITHDLNVVKNIADQVVVMYQGKIVETGETEEIFNKPKHRYTQGLLACRPHTNHRVKRLSTVQEYLQNEIPTSDHYQNIISNQAYEENIQQLNTRTSIINFKEVSIGYPIQKNLLGKVTKWFWAVNELSFQIREKETLGLVGESGCGKSTIGKALVNLVPIQKGEILYKGKNIHSFSTSEWKDYRREVQIIFQDPYSSLNPRISIGKAIQETMDVHDIYATSERKDEVSNLLQKVGLLPEHYGRYPHEFSGGQRQRICIARTLALKPTCIICDESVSALDISVQAQVLNLLASLKEDFALTYLFISHDLKIVNHISDYIMVMQEGKKIEYNHADAIYHHPEKPYTQSLLSSIS